MERKLRNTSFSKRARINQRFFWYALFSLSFPIVTTIITYFNSFEQTQVVKKYYFNGNGYNERLIILDNYYFNYNWSFIEGSNEIYGKWKLNGDTLTLFSSDKTDEINNSLYKVYSDSIVVIGKHDSKHRIFYSYDDNWVFKREKRKW